MLVFLICVIALDIVGVESQLELVFTQETFKNRRKMSSPQK